MSRRTRSIVVAVFVLMASLVGTSVSPAGAATPGFEPFGSWSALVQRVHTDLVASAPSSSVLSTWTRDLDAGTKSEGHLVDSLRRGSENTTNVDPATRLYRAFMGRTPDAGGLKFWVARRRSGAWTLIRSANYFAESSEFKAKYGPLSNRAFVTLIYTDVMGRPADTGGVNYWTAQLDKGSKSRGAVMVGFSESSEYKNRQRENVDVAVAYIFLLNKTPNTTEVTDWVTRQKAGTTHAALAKELLDTAAYSKHITGVAPTAPGAPSAVVASPGNGQAALIWDTPSSSGGMTITGYVITPYIGATAQTPVNSTGNATTKVITGLVNGTAYTFKVSATNGVGTGAQSNASSAATPSASLSAPGAPTAVTATAGNAQVSLSWGAPGSNGGSTIIGYVITPYIGAAAQSPTYTTGSSTTRVVTGLTNGTAYTFKVAALNGVGTGAQSSSSSTVTPTAPALAAKAISVGDTHSCAVLTSGSVRCWGDNSQGQLGNGSNAASLTPKAVSSITNAKSVSAGSSHTCAVLTTGAVRCWGSNIQGKLGNGSTNASTVPVAVSGITNATTVSAGSTHSCAVLSTGAVRCWGYSGDGKLGNGSTNASSVPVAVTGIANAVGVTAASAHSCAVLSTGGVKCWGYNLFGRLGNGSSTASTVPVNVSGISNAVSVSAKGNHTCAVLSTGGVKCWGRNSSGQLGNGSWTDSSVPVSVSAITTAKAGVVGGSHSCAVLASGGAQCWGFNQSGALGNGSSVTSYTPVAVSAITSAVSIGAADKNSCALLSSGSVRCWGDNAYGQLGNGTKTYSLVPVLVSGF
ncbi:MAG: DUF4214 domain-containing protein [Acidimicrobiales bacterium]|nr:DUF4214 domain-containing protein [Acidimicrobiales bacterium]